MIINLLELLIKKQDGNTDTSRSIRQCCVQNTHYKTSEAIAEVASHVVPSSPSLISDGPLHGNMKTCNYHPD